MHLKKLISFWTILLLLTACATHNSTNQNFTSIPSLEEQCKILNKKRESVKIKRSNHSSRKVRKNYFAIAEVQRTPSNPETVGHEPLLNIPYSDNHFPEPTVTEIQASISPNPILIIDHQEISTNHADLIPMIEAERDTITPSSSTVIETEITNQPGVENNFIPLLAGASGILSIFLLGAFQRQSKRISIWAAQNPWKTRGILTATHLCTCAGAIACGHQLATNGFIISEAAKYIAISAIGAAVCIYPMSRTANYLRRKTQDVILFTSGAVMMLYAGNHYDVKQQQYPVQPIYSFANKTQANEWHVVKKEISIPTIKKQEEPKKKSTGDKVGLAILATLAFLALGYGIAALSCSLSCSGHQAMASIVGIGGAIGLVIGFITIMRLIFRKGGKKKKTKIRTTGHSSIEFQESLGMIIFKEIYNLDQYIS